MSSAVLFGVGVTLIGKADAAAQIFPLRDFRFRRVRPTKAWVTSIRVAGWLMCGFAVVVFVYGLRLL